MYDVLVVGGGIAGLRAALEALRRGAQTALITKAHPLSSYSVTVQDGINAALGSADSWESHALDTVRSGDYLADQPVVEAFCQEAPQALRELDAMGVPFHRDQRGELAQAMLAGSGQARACHVHDMTGHALTQVLYEQALKAGLQFIEEWYVVSLLNDGGECRGVAATQLASGKMALFPAKAVVLATGGIRRLYEPSTGSILCNADAIGLAYQAGVSLVDMEMVQYHPCVVKKGRLAVSELLLANGA
jgi:succinate dehydrogenase / fumarate reductase flavoprotein subunit